MRQLAELVPIALFFIVYKISGYEIDLGGFHYTFDGIYTATLVLIIATVVQVVLTKLITGVVEKRLWLLFVVVLVAGSLTLAFHDDVFIKWKPTIFNWGLAIAFFVAPLIGNKSLMERAMGGQIDVPKAVWARLNTIWTAYFFIVGALNLYVAFGGYTQEFWVSYKLYSSIGFTIVLSIITVIILAPHLKEDEIKNLSQDQ
ncbi:MAG: inner membrane-spanning protein YciB [Pseudomonadales bacterium]